MKFLKFGILISSILGLGFAIPAVANDYGNNYKNSELYRKVCSHGNCHYVKVQQRYRQQIFKERTIQREYRQEAQKPQCSGQLVVLSQDQHGTRYRCYFNRH